MEHCGCLHGSCLALGITLRCAGSVRVALLGHTLRVAHVARGLAWSHTAPWVVKSKNRARLCCLLVFGICYFRPWSSCSWSRCSLADVVKLAPVAPVAPVELLAPLEPLAPLASLLVHFRACLVVFCCVLLCFVVLCCVVFCFVVFCVVFCCVLLCFVVFCCGLLCCVAFWCVLLCLVVLCCALLCCVLCLVVLCCCVLLCFVVSSCVVFCFVLLCFVVLFCALWVEFFIAAQFVKNLRQRFQPLKWRFWST